MLTRQFNQIAQAFVEKGIDLVPAVILSESEAVRLFNEVDRDMVGASIFMISNAEKIRKVNGGMCYGVKIFVE